MADANEGRPGRPAQGCKPPTDPGGDYDDDPLLDRDSRAIIPTTRKARPRRPRQLREEHVDGPFLSR